MFENHVPGEAYELTRQQFLIFAGFDPGLSTKELWAAIALREAERQFNPLSTLCHSELFMDTEDGSMNWWYQTTSGTELQITEHRAFLTQPAPGYPGLECSFELPKAVYNVTIPVERDQPDRYHWKQLRNGGSYCS